MSLSWPRALEPLLSQTLTMQVYRLLFGPLPDLDGKLGLHRKQESWSHLGNNPLFQMEVRGLMLGEGWKESLFLSYT